MTIPHDLLDDLEKRRREAMNAGGEKKLQARRAKGLMTARERVEGLVQPGTFQEMNAYAHHHATEFGMGEKRMPGDGVITGVGLLDGKPVACFSQDFTVGGGSLGNVHAGKIADVMDYALKTGIPVVGFNDSGGARIQEGVEALAGYGKVFYKNVLLSGVVPQIAVIAGPCAGGAAYSPALMDVLIMTKTNAHMFITGPEVIKAVTGQNCSADEIGSAAAHATISGNIHFVAEDDAHAIQLVKQVLSYLPANNLLDPPHQPSAAISLEPDSGMDALIPESPKTPLDMQQVIARLLDPGSFLEVQRDWAKNMICGWGRLEGLVVGVVANQPMVKAGSIDIDASDKAARFIRLCNLYNIPLISLVDVPGFLPGVQQERGGIIRHGSKMLFAWAGSTVPKITMILRKAYGGAYLAMCNKDMGADLVFAWPCAEIAVMGAEGAVNILFKDELKKAADPKARSAEIAAEYRGKFASPWQAAEAGQVTDVIEPSRTRSTLAMALRNTLTKRDYRPQKKHGNIAL